jgi:hypothetical protein
MDHALRIDLFDRPDVGDLGGTEEMVGCAFPPTVKTPLVITHEVFPRQHRVLLHPNQRLREVQPAAFQDGRIIGHIGVAAPDVEGATRLQYAGQVAKPRLQETVELSFRNEVVRQGTVFGPQFPMCGFGFLGMASQVELLVMSNFVE